MWNRSIKNEFSIKIKILKDGLYKHMQNTVVKIL